MPGGAEYYRAAIDGQACMRIPGRFRRHRLPLPGRPPPDDDTDRCFLCHPERDRHFLGRLGAGGELAVVGNAFPVADRALLVAPRGPLHHSRTPAELPADVLAALLPVSLDPRFLQRFELAGLDVASFLNIGEPAAQSRRHPHLQVIGFDPGRGTGTGGDPRAVAADLREAAREGRELPLTAGAALVIPRCPGMTAEAWVAFPAAATAGQLRAFARGVARACRACEAGIAGNYNLVIVPTPGLLRIVPRGLSERAGLELACPQHVSTVIAATVSESVTLWHEALDSVPEVDP